MTPSFEVRDPEYAARVARSFARQGIMVTLGAELVSVAPGAVEVALPIGPKVAQQHGFAHAGAVATIADSAAGFASLTLMSPSAGVLTAEFKINLMAPAAGERLIAQGRVLKPGRTLTFAQSEVFAESGGIRRLVAFLTATLMAVEGRDGIRD